MEETRAPRKPKAGGPDPWLGTTLGGRYRVIRKIAEGGMGAVYEGEQTAIGRRVAVKMLHAHLARDEEIVGRFRREALATTAIGHAHIVEVLDLGELEDGTLFMVLELLDGRDLARLLKDEGPISIGRAARILAQVCEGVAAAHAKEIVHRDLKPENVFLITRGEDREFVKVLDFGVSKIRAQLEGEGEERAKTKTGTALGTPYYMAPEQAQGRRDVDHRADVYALGVILFRMLTGHHPFDDESYPMLVLKICTEPPPQATTWRGDLPPGLVALLDRMLAKDPADRPASVAEVRAELDRYRMLDGAPALTGAPPPASAAPGVLRTRDHSPAAMARTQQATPAMTAREREEEEEEVAETASKVVPPSRGNPIAMFAAGVMALATIAMVVYAVSGDDAPIEPDPEEVALPTPREPVVRAFAPAGGSGRDAGWTWVNPRPRAMPTWYAVAVGGPGLIAMVGQDGAAARFLAGSLVTWRTGTTSTLRAIAWVSPDEAMAVGEGGTIVRLTARGPSSVASGVDTTLRAVAPIGPTEVLVAGDGGVLATVRGTAIRHVESGVTTALLALHERGDVTWIAGEGGTILRMEGQAIARATSGTGVTLRAIGGCERGDLYAAGDQATLIRRRGDGTWINVRTDLDRGESLESITCDRGRAAIVGSRGSVLLASGSNVVAIPSGFERAWHGVAGASDETTWTVGAGGRLATIEEDHLETRTSGPAVPLRDVAAIGGAIVAVGEWGRVVRERESGFEESESPTDAGLAAVVPLDESRLLAVGDHGVVLEIGWDAARLLPSPVTDASLRDVLVAADGRVLAVGTGGTLLRGAPDALAASRVPEGGDLWAIAGTPDDAIAVGDGASVVHVSATGAARWPCEQAAGASLRAVVRDGPLAIAVGEGGVIVQVAAGGCTEEHRGGPTLDAVVRGPDGHLLAVGEDGAAWTRDDAGRWTEADLELGGNHARGARRIGRYLYVVGTGGSIVRHILTDGT